MQVASHILIIILFSLYRHCLSHGTIQLHRGFRPLVSYPQRQYACPALALEGFFFVHIHYFEVIIVFHHIFWHYG